MEEEDEEEDDEYDVDVDVVPFQSICYDHCHNHLQPSLR